MSSCLNSCGLCGRAYHDPGARRAGTRKSRAPSGVERVRVGRLDLDEVAGAQHRASRGVDPRAQPDRRAGRARARATQVEVAVLEARLLADRDALVDLEGQRRRGVEHLELADDDLDVARRQVGVGVALGALAHLAGDLDAELVAHVVRPAPGQHLVAGDDLGDPRGIAQVEEGDTAVVSTPRHPPGERDGLACVALTVGAQCAGLVSAEHGGSFRRCMGSDGGVCRWARSRGHRGPILDRLPLGSSPCSTPATATSTASEDSPSSSSSPRTPACRCAGAACRA